MKLRLLVALFVVSILLCSVASAGGSDKFDLSNFDYRYVDSSGRGSLVFQKAPRGKFMSGHKFYDGDMIYVNLYWRESGYSIAYENGEYGYVDASYIDWNNTPGEKKDPKPVHPDKRSSWKLDYIGDRYVVNCNEWVSLRERADTSSNRLTTVPLGAKVTNVYNTIYDFYFCEYKGQRGFIQKKYLSEKPSTTRVDKYDLSLYEYRRVNSNGRGKLIFQKSPRGSFMYDYQYYDSDWIYVNVKWRSEGYAMAYEDGVYGYVDASYISW